MVTIACFYLIVIATLPMLFPLADDIKRDLKVLQRSLRDIEQRKRMAKPLAQLIQFHSDTKQLGFNFSQTHSRFIEFYFFLFESFQIGTRVFTFLAYNVDDVAVILSRWHLQ